MSLLKGATAHESLRNTVLDNLILYARKLVHQLTMEQEQSAEWHIYNMAEPPEQSPVVFHCRLCSISRGKVLHGGSKYKIFRTHDGMVSTPHNHTERGRNAKSIANLHGLMFIANLHGLMFIANLHGLMFNCKPAWLDVQLKKRLHLCSFVKTASLRGNFIQHKEMTLSVVDDHVYRRIFRSDFACDWPVLRLATGTTTMHTAILTSTAHRKINVSTFACCSRSFPSSGYDICKRALVNEVTKDSSIHLPIMNQSVLSNRLLPGYIFPCQFLAQFIYCTW